MTEAIDGMLDQPISRSMISHDLEVPASYLVEAAYESFRHHAEEFVAVTEGKRLVGMISRAQIAQIVSGRFGFALFAKASILHHLAPDSLRLIEGTPLLEVLQLTLFRKGEAFLQDVALVDAAGNYIGVIRFETLVRRQALIVRNQINEAKEGRELLRLQNVELQSAKEAAEKANRVKGDFLANMSHEVRTPMHGIIGLTQLALEGELPPAERELVQRASESASSLLGILNDILDLTKIEAGKLHVEHVPFDLERSLDLVKSLFGQLSADKGIQFEVFRMPDVPRGLIGDALRLRQILNNMLSNALKFTTEGKVTLSVRTQAHSQKRQHVTLQFEVRDTGIGITPEQQQRIFDPFEQADTSITRRFGGTGLGLAISKHLTTMMGGSIELESKAGEGSAFRINLPFGVSNAMFTETQPQELSPALNLHGVRVLLVEDNRINVLLATKLLEREGVKLTVAGNGQFALDILNSKPGAFDLVLMDIQMPILDGHETTRRLRTDHRFDSLPIIAMTADAMSDDRQTCLDVGMQDYLPKPVNADLLFATVDRWRNTPQKAVSPAIPLPTEPEPAPLSPDAAIARLKASVEFADAAAALERLNNDAELYWTVLTEFVAAQATFMETLRAFFVAPGDAREAHRAAHTMKGLASTMGAETLLKCCQRLDASLHEGKPSDDAQALFAEVEAALHAVLHRIELVSANIR